jgi:hypothetical protein
LLWQPGLHRDYTGHCLGRTGTRREALPVLSQPGRDLGGDTAVRTDRRTVLRHGDENRRLGGGLASPFGGT